MRNGKSDALQVLQKYISQFPAMAKDAESDVVKQHLDNTTFQIQSFVIFLLPFSFSSWPVKIAQHLAFNEYVWFSLNSLWVL